MATLTERLLLIVDADSKGAARGLDDVSGSANRAQRSVDDLGRSSKNLGDTLKAGLALGAGAVLGGGIVDAALDIGRAYFDAAKGVEQFANATNSTIEQSSQFMGLAKSMGLDINDLLEITAEFTQKAEAMKDQLADVGIELQKNADGSINLSESLVDALEGLQAIPDDVTRSRIAFQLFGEEGAKQLAGIYNSSKDVRESLEDLDLGIDSGDIAKAKEFNAAMLDLKQAGQELGFNLAGSLIPALTTLANVLSPIAGLLGDIQPEVLLLGGAMFGLSQVNLGPLRSGMAGVLTEVTDLADWTDESGRRMGTLGAAATVAKDKASGAFANMVGALDPLTVGIGTAMVGFQLYGSAIDAADKAAKDAIPRMKELTDAGLSQSEALEKTAQEVSNSASAWERLGAEFKAGPQDIAETLNPLINVAEAFTNTGEAAKGFEESIREQAEALGPAAVAAAEMGLQQKELNDVIAEGISVNSGQFAQAVRDSAQAQVEQKAATDLATDSINAYIAATTGAVDATLAAASSTYAQSDAFRSAQTAIAEAATTVDDGATVIDEAAAAQDNAAQAALRYAAAALVAAEDQAALRGEVLSASEAADVQIAALQALAEQPGISETTRANIQSLIDQLTAAKEKGDEGVNVQVGQSGAEEAGAEIDAASGERTAEVNIESRNGPAVTGYITDTVAAERMAIVRVESRNGPAVISYLDSIDDERLAIIRVESRNGPAVISYLDSIAGERLAIIRVETRNGPAVDAYLDSLATNFGAGRTATISQRTAAAAAAGPSAASPVGFAALAAVSATNPAAPSVAPLAATGARVTVQNTYRITNEVATGANPVEVGRATVDAIRTFEASAGRGWRT